MKDKLNKKNILEFAIILIITLLLCQNFLQMHYSSDTYVLYDLGYMKYPSEYFLLDGRLISTLVCYTAGILNIPIPAYIIGMDFIGIIFMAISIYMLFKILEKIINPEKEVNKIMLIAVSFLTILNQFAIEYLLFPESAVMCLGVLLNVIAVKIMVENPKHKYLKIFICLFLAGISYQGVLNIFPILAMAVYIVKQLTDKREYKIKEKEFFIEMIKLAVILVIVLFICMEIVSICKTLLNSKQDRTIHLIDYEAYQLRWKTVLKYLDELWNNSMHMLPRNLNSIVLATSFVMFIILKTKKEMIMQYVLLIFIAFVVCIVPMFIFDSGVCGRVNVPLTMLWGISLMIVLTQSLALQNCAKERIVYAIIIASFLINSIYLMQNITEHISANRVDENTGETIKAAIENYEQAKGIKVTKLGYIYDQKPQMYAVGIRNIGSLTERKFACSWCIVEAMNYYCERKFEEVKVSMDVYQEKIPKKDYTGFSEDELVFDGDTLYMVIY